MTSSSSRWALLGKFAAVTLAGLGVALLYRFGFADIGGVLVLSAVLVSVITFVRSGGLSASWLLVRDRQTLVRLGFLELAKSFVCAGVGIDAVRILVAAVGNALIPANVVSSSLVLTVAVVCAMGAGLFLTRAFAAHIYLRHR
jgi:hypothetical protein